MGLSLLGLDDIDKFNVLALKKVKNEKWIKNNKRSFLNKLFMVYFSVFLIKKSQRRKTSLALIGNLK